MMEDINLVLQSIAEKTKKLIKENQELRNFISEMEDNTILINELKNKINILNNQLSDEKEKQLRTKETAQELLREIDECIKLYSKQ